VGPVIFSGRHLTTGSSPPANQQLLLAGGRLLSGQGLVGRCFNADLDSGGDGG
jgi:hypothetical protein